MPYWFLRPLKLYIKKKIYGKKHRKNINMVRYVVFTLFLVEIKQSEFKTVELRLKLP